MTREHHRALPAAEERNAVVAVYGNLEHAENAVRTLEREGFDMSHLPTKSWREPAPNRSRCTSATPSS